MTDQLTGLAPAPADNADGGNGEEPKGSGSAAAATEQPSPASPDNLDWAKAKGWVADDGTLKSDELAKGYLELTKHLSTVKKVPDDKATPGQVDDFHKSLGWPGEPKGYEFKLPEGLPENLPYDEGFATGFKEAANVARLTAKQAQAVHDWYVKQFASDATGFETEVTEKAKTAHTTLIKDWGEPGSETYIQNRDAATRAVRSDPKLAGLEGDLKAAGFLTKDGNFASPAIAHLLSEHGKRFQNDTLVGNAGGNAGANNPFAAVSLNLTEQGVLIRKDPAKARTLAAAAGWPAEKIREVFGS